MEFGFASFVVRENFGAKDAVRSTASVTPSEVGNMDTLGR